MDADPSIGTEILIILLLILANGIFAMTEIAIVSEHYQTLGGFITSYLGNLPKTGEKFEWAGFRFEIVDMDKMRIDKVIVTRLDIDMSA